MNGQLLLLFIAHGLLVTGCAGHNSITDDHFHTLALTLDLPHPAYLIGIEKASADEVGSVPFGTCPSTAVFCLNGDAAYLKDKPEWRETLVRRLDDPKRLFITHVAAYERIPHESGVSRWHVRLLSNLYHEGTLSCAKSHNHASPTCIQEGIEAFQVFKADLEQRVARERATHVLFYSTGWNSDQVDSIRRYNLFFKQVAEAARQDGAREFRPIFIGITWPADWPELPSHSDIFGKKNDADEVAVTWVNYLFNQILLPLKAKGVKIVAIGHSFGGRVVTTAANSRDLLPTPVVEKINLVVGLQAAFSIKRFDGGTEGDPFRDFSKYADKFVFVSSRHDEAGKPGGLPIFSSLVARAVNPILGEEGIREAQEGDLARRFEVITVNESGHWKQAPNNSPDKALLLDASAIVQKHNDVNNPQVGRLLWMTIKTFAP